LEPMPEQETDEKRNAAARAAWQAFLSAVRESPEPLTGSQERLNFRRKIGIFSMKTRAVKQAGGREK